MSVDRLYVEGIWHEDPLTGWHVYLPADAMPAGQWTIEHQIPIYPDRPYEGKKERVFLTRILLPPSTVPFEPQEPT